MKFEAFGIALCASALCFSSPARADCPWGDEPIKSVYATMTLVNINGHEFYVRGAPARAEFMGVLADCHADPESVRLFSEWRGLRRATNWTVGLGLLCLPILLATPVTAVVTGLKKDEMVWSMLGVKDP